MYGPSGNNGLINYLQKLTGTPPVDPKPDLPKLTNKFLEKISDVEHDTSCFSMSPAMMLDGTLCN